YDERVRTQYTRLETSRIATFGEQANSIGREMMGVNRQTRITLLMTEILSLLLAISALVVWIKDVPEFRDYYEKWGGTLAGVSFAWLSLMLFYLGLRVIVAILHSRPYAQLTLHVRRLRRKTTDRRP